LNIICKLFKNPMFKIIDIFLSTIYYLFFCLFLLIFHPIQWLSFKLFGPKIHQKVVQILNFFLLYTIYFTGANTKFVKKGIIPPDRPILFVSNHQSMFDIVGIIWYLRHYNPIFVSKIELAKGIPSISLNLRLSGAALIDRNDSRQAVPEITRMAKYAQSQGFSPVIFPEGTRSKTDEIKPFAVGGVAIILKYTKNAIVIPIAIKGNNKINPKGFFPLRSFQKISFCLLHPIEPAGLSAEEICAKAEEMIRLENRN
jgi:1-acyl-sn-glycerol-3-phosphate acyltransferase